MISVTLFHCCENVYPYEYMNYWEKVNETSLPEKEDFCNYLSVKEITDEDLFRKSR